MYKGSPKHKADKARWQRRWRANNKTKDRNNWETWAAQNGYDRQTASRASHLRRKYGITQADYDRLLKQQNGVCAICRKPPVGNDPLVVDHNHDTQVVRGLLHRRCNSAIGLLHDDALLLRLAAEYLERITS